MASLEKEKESNHIEWNGDKETRSRCVDLLRAAGQMIVTATKVGYIIMTTDEVGLQRKFSAKQRPTNKPGVVLCVSMDQLRQLAQLNDEIESLYQKAWDEDVLLGCILPWKESAKHLIPNDGSDALMMDRRSTSCFVVKFGLPSELVAHELWIEHGKISFASSANPSGKGNSGRVMGIGEKIYKEADLVVGADDYVHSMQPDKTVDTRYEQGVMVSMVDQEGKLIPMQNGQRSVLPRPVIIRKGLAIDRIMSLLSETFMSWNYEQGTYY